MFEHFERSLRAALVGLLISLANEARAEGSIPPGDIRKAVERGIALIENDGVTWMKTQKCATCHHVPLMIWTLNEARQQGYQVNEKVLGEVTAWALAEKNHAQVFQDLPIDKNKTEKDYLGPLMLALAVGANKERDETTEKERNRLLAHVLSQQAKDGSWDANRGGRPPIHASKDVQTSLVYLALADTPVQGDDRWKAQRELSAEWLSRNPPANTHQSLAMRLLVLQRLGKPTEEIMPLLESLLRGQNDEGGWSQSNNMKSDAFATGLAIYTLSGHQGAQKAIRRAQDFLIQSQQPDGAWLMQSRPSEPTGSGPARYLVPIRLVGVAWATIGLIRTGPRGDPD